MNKAIAKIEQVKDLYILSIKHKGSSYIEIKEFKDLELANKELKKYRDQRYLKE